MKKTLLLLPFALAVAACSSDDEGSLIERSELERGCVISAGCGVKTHPSVQGCVDYYFDVQVPSGLGRTYGDIFRCVLGAEGDCDDVRACFGPGDVCDKDFQGYCSGSKAFACDLIDYKVYVEDCALSGLICAADSSFAAECRCEGGYSYCEGEWALSCSAGRVESDHCAAAGKTCQSGRCVASGAAKGCDEEPPRCEEDIAVRCEGNVELRVDCATFAVPLMCDRGSCVPREDECLDDFNRCTDDNTLEACLVGRWARFDCAALGFDQCLPADHGANCYVGTL